MATARINGCVGESMPTLEFQTGGTATHQFMAWLPSVVLGPKLMNFIRGNDATVLDTSTDHVRMRIGGKSWTARRQEIPMEVTLTVNRLTVCVRRMTHVIADMRALRRVSQDAEYRRKHHD